jgi:hypothetical protein
LEALPASVREQRRARTADHPNGSGNFFWNHHFAERGWYIFREHFWITTSGFFSDTALMCSMMEMGIDRILFSVDYPFAENLPGTEWLKTLPLGPEDTDKLLNGNARRLLKI